MKMVILMLNLLNKMFFYGKIFLHIIVFSISLYILLMMHDRYNFSAFSIIMVFIPMVLVLISFVINFFFDKGNKNILFNLANFIVLLSILIICLRTLFDKNMIMGIKENINFYFFQNHLKQIKILCYLIFIGNGLILFQEKNNIKE